MRHPERLFRQRLTWLVVLSLVAVSAALTVAVLVARHANGDLNEVIDDVQWEAPTVVRQFRTGIDELHGALLRMGREDIDVPAVVHARRTQLSAWLVTRQASDLTAEERSILHHLDSELTLYNRMLDQLAARPDGLRLPLTRDELVQFDDHAIRLQGLADDFAAADARKLRDLLEATQQYVLRLRNLVFICQVLLAIIIGYLLALVYKHVVHPLRERLVESQDLLAQKEKLAALGTLAAGVAHEIRNPLTAIKARLYTLTRLQTQASGTEDVLSIKSEVTRLERIVTDVLGYARPAEPRWQPLALADWLHEFGQSFALEGSLQFAELTVEAPDPIPVQVDPDQLRQVLLNLVRNADEALAGQPGQIVLTLTRERSRASGRGARAPSQEFALLTVADNGPGIPPEMHGRLFDPFFTSKAGGTGLGLSIVARLVEQQGGEISFQSAVGVGTRFFVRLPVVSHPPQNHPL